MQICQHKQIAVAESDKGASKSTVLWGEISNAVMRHKKAVMSELWSRNIITTVFCIYSIGGGYMYNRWLENSSFELIRMQDYEDLDDRFSV